MFAFLFVGAGAFFGAISRFIISRAINSRDVTKIPFGTLAVNLLGSFLLGTLLASNASNEFLLFAGTGFLGAFTTFSTMKLELVQLRVHQQRIKLYFYLLISYATGILLAFVGNKMW